MRKTAIVVATGIVCISAWLIYSKVAQHRREASYQARILPLRQALPNGTPMIEVARYLDSHGIGYGAVHYGSRTPNWTYQVKIAEEPGDHLVCAK